MPRNAPWAMDYKKKREENIPQQMTVVRRIAPSNGGNGVPRETFGVGGGNGMEIGTPISSSRMTGAGVDGIVQPGKRVGEVHEEEGILNRNAMQALGPELFMTLSKSLEMGTADINKIREAVGQPTVQGYQYGGIHRNEDIPGAGAQPAEYNRPTIQTTAPSERTVTRNTPRIAPQVNPQQSQPTTMFMPTVQNQPLPERETPRTAPVNNTVSMPTIENQPTRTTPGAETPIATSGTGRGRFGYGPTADEDISGGGIATSGTRRGTFGYGPTEEEQEPMPESEVPQQTTMSQFAQESVRNALQYFNNQAAGMSESDRNIANFYLQNMDATNAENMRVLEHQISSDPYMSDAAKRTAIMAAQREFNARRDQMSGELAMSSQQRADQAAAQAAGLGQNIQAYEDITKPAAQQAMELERRTYEEITLPTSRQNNEIAKRYFEEIQLPTGMVNLEQLKSSFNNEQWGDVQDMISKGLGPERINGALAKMGLQPLSDQEYAAMLAASPLGERDWGRQLSVANFLLQTPGGTNKEAAAIMLSNIFPGVDFDFSELISMENAERFGSGLSQMASYVAADMTFDEALDAMRGDETLNWLGMDENTAAQLYNSLRVNAIDAEWEQYSTSDFFLGLTPEEQNEATEFFKAKTLGKLDYTTLHEYNLYDIETGDLVNTIWAKDDTEATKAIAGKNLKFEDTGNIQYRMASTIDTTSTGTGDEEQTLQDAWDAFQASQELLPVDQQVGRSTWFELAEKHGLGAVPKTIDEWKTSDLVPTTSPLTDLQVESYSDLLTKNNSEKLFDAYKEDPDELRGSEFFYELPGVEYIRGNVTHSYNQNSGKHTTTTSNELSSTLDDSVGKFIELTYYEMDGKKFVAYGDVEGSKKASGQLKKWRLTPHTLQIKVKNEDGTYTDYVVSSG